jgi:hypothetical protein
LGIQQWRGDLGAAVLRHLRPVHRRCPRLTLVYPYEIFPTEIRAFAVGVGTSVSRIGAAVGTYLVPISLGTLGIAQTM